MKIEEAIKHAEEKEKENKKLSKRYDDASGYSRSGNKDIRTNEAKKCEKCAEEHRQLAEWLKDYKRLLEQEQKTGHWTRELIRNEYGGCIGAKMICSECGQDNGYDKRMKFCPNCGAKMEE